MAEQDLNSLAADISATAKRNKPAVSKPNFGNSQSEPKAPTNVAPAVASAANKATGGYAGAAANVAASTVSGGAKQVARGALGLNKP